MIVSPSSLICVIMSGGFFLYYDKCFPKISLFQASIVSGMDKGSQKTLPEMLRLTVVGIH